MDGPDDADKAAHDPAGNLVDDKGSAGGASADGEPQAAMEEAMTGERAFEQSLEQLQGQSRDLKAKIAEERQRHEMPIDSALGDPAIERRNADGRNDLPDRDED